MHFMLIVVWRKLSTLHAGISFLEILRWITRHSRTTNHVPYVDNTKRISQLINSSIWPPCLTNDQGELTPNSTICSYSESPPSFYKINSLGIPVRLRNTCNTWLVEFDLKTKMRIRTHRNRTGDRRRCRKADNMIPGPSFSSTWTATVAPLNVLTSPAVPSNPQLP